MTNADEIFLNEALPQLKEYLLSGELYWPLGGALTRLTPGAALLALTRLSVSQPDSAAVTRRKLEALTGQWRSAWEKKTRQETANRLRLWSAFLAECEESASRENAAYTGEVRGRVILQLLDGENPEIAALDARLKRFFYPGNFIWEAPLTAAFPQPDFWFLYGSLKP
ncbi:MAG: hypothetical protein CO094_06915 [Anaerolineae bacterium CG_4_9_14_3_um_filter_57_17]|nr:hypothetical protein [bacterium]NCT21710.1 hypothetical protein [bacterium]OIO84542.1 MAG: hypothetical protein AUK01_08995 [Anaerolineae bacterium CG2_30_57_67]PJB66496.1 MAG: hypothetical protein CO094_06915 [Anaerolineae bacterium CG_4_9_14_3_um_filter_57_17]